MSDPSLPCKGLDIRKDYELGHKPVDGRGSGEMHRVEGGGDIR